MTEIDYQTVTHDSMVEMAKSVLNEDYSEVSFRMFLSIVDYEGESPSLHEDGSEWDYWELEEVWEKVNNSL